MAYLINDKDEEQLRQGAQASGGGAFAGEAAQNPQGTGGEKTWVNIQEYLGANPNSGAGSALLEKDAGKPVQNELNRFQNEVNNYESRYNTQGLGSVNTNLDANADYEGIKSDYLNSLAGFGPDSDELRSSYGQSYQSALDRAKNIATNGFQPPDIGAFNFSPSGDINTLKTNLDNTGVNSNFENYMSGLYNKEYQALTPGERDLQRQFDIGDTRLEKTRDKIARDVSGLFGRSSRKETELNTKRNEDLNKVRSAVDNLKTGYQRTVDQFADFDRRLNEKKYGYQGFDESGLKLRDIYSAKELGDLVLKNKREGWNGLGERQQAENFKNIVAALRGGFVNPSPTYVNRVPGGGTFKK